MQNLKAILMTPCAQIKLWNVNTQQCMRDFNKTGPNSAIVSLLYDNNSAQAHFWSSSLAPRLSVWDIHTGLELHELNGTSHEETFTVISTVIKPGTDHWCTLARAGARLQTGAQLLYSGRWCTLRYA